MNAIHVIMLTYRRNMARTCTDLLSISLVFGEKLPYITPATSVVFRIRATQRFNNDYAWMALSE